VNFTNAQLAALRVLRTSVRPLTEGKIVTELSKHGVKPGLARWAIRQLAGNGLAELSVDPLGRRSYQITQAGLERIVEADGG